METSNFTDPQKPPSARDLANSLGASNELLAEIIAFAHLRVPGLSEEWNFSKSSGWNLRIKNKKKVLIYIMPCDRFFRASFVLGARAAEQALSADISEAVKETISSARVYAEGRGFRINVKEKNTAGDIRKLIDIKLAGK